MINEKFEKKFLHYKCFLTPCAEMWLRFEQIRRPLQIETSLLVYTNHAIYKKPYIQKKTDLVSGSLGSRNGLKCHFTWLYILIIDSFQTMTGVEVLTLNILGSSLKANLEEKTCLTPVWIYSMCEPKIMQPYIFVVAIISSRCQHGGVGFNDEAILKTF